jgi:dihydroorotate dehydrogenase subfamily 2
MLSTSFLPPFGCQYKKSPRGDFFVGKSCYNAPMKRTGLILGSILIILALLGILDAGYLTWEHYNHVIPSCAIGSWFPDCGKVLTSPYSSLFGIPLALLGLIHYTVEFTILSIAFLQRKKWTRIVAVLLGTLGFFMSMYFVYLMAFVIGAFCKYCLASALISTCIFFVVHAAYPNDRRWWVAKIGDWIYSVLLKPIFFKIDPEAIHVSMVLTGQRCGTLPGFYAINSWLLSVSDPRLSQKIVGIKLENPVGLAAGFDYEARLTQVLGSVGFGFQSVGTITHGAYEGNPRPMLGRLPLSKSLMVNKGFKNLGVAATIESLKGKRFPVPVGISIGRTNDLTLATVEKSIKDIVSAFKLLKASHVPNAYYELNISCPNLKGDVSFYPPENLEKLLAAVDRLKLAKPLFIKMPISETNKATLAMLAVISRHSPAGVIFGNLLKDRKSLKLVKSEVAKFPVGNFSGKPTFDRSNELISLVYKKYKNRFVIIGCGGIFTAEDAYEKIKRGASLVQMITGMIYQGPQTIENINNGLLDLLERDGYTSIAQAIGTYNK